MFGEVASLLQRFGGGSADESASAQAAAEDHVQSLPADEVQDHVQTAADNARNSGQSDVAQLLERVLAGGASEEDLKQGLIDAVKSNPQILAHFAPSFAQGILSRI
jgi:hypothetical protein